MATRLRSGSNRFRTSVAPMIDVTDPMFLRMLRLVSPFGSHQLWTEMVHANAFSRGKIHQDRVRLARHIPLHELRDFSEGVVVQIGASDPSDARVAVHELGKLGVKHINLNCGCPSRNVQMGSFGAVLMKTPDVVGDIVSAMVDAADSPDAGRSPIQISVKCRIGIDHDESPEFLREFIRVVASRARYRSSDSQVSFVLHTRRAWLDGLSPEQNRTVPKLNYERAYEMTKEFPDTSFVINGGIDSIEAVTKHLQVADGVMMGRKIREDPWFLSALDKHVYNIPEHELPDADAVMEQYVTFADQMHREFGFRYSLLGRPLLALFNGGKGRALRRNLGQSVAKAKIKNGNDITYAVPFSTLVQEAVYNAQQEHRLSAAVRATPRQPQAQQCVC
ncbi:hypothetical protein GGI12_001125 [Dipsacomyces acuminosporus]|nr:hypothetical protein GGI12_001125 [Dipsacomyces acuminosporus]